MHLYDQKAINLPQTSQSSIIFKINYTCRMLYVRQMYAHKHIRAGNQNMNSISPTAESAGMMLFCS